MYLGHTSERPIICNFTKTKDPVMGVFLEILNFSNHIFHRKPLQKLPFRGVLRKRYPQICSKFTGEHPCRSTIPFPKITSGRLLLPVGYCLCTKLQLTSTINPGGHDQLYGNKFCFLMISDKLLSVLTHANPTKRTFQQFLENKKSLTLTFLWKSHEMKSVQNQNE